ncbi:MAG: DUF938 domain-containing protein [Cyanobacteria bacterium J06639_1]
MTDDRQYAPATQRNREPILAVLQNVLPDSGTVLEISSGTGEHAVYFAPHLPALQWLPSDVNPLALASITAWRDRQPTPNLHPPIALDAGTTPWIVEAPERIASPDLAAHSIQAIVNINMIHIAPWSACLGLMAGAGRVLPEGGVLVLYGPFRQRSVATAPSNETFDRSLKSQHPEWGLRQLEEVEAIARQHHLTLVETRPMPANNLTVIWHKT